MFWCFISELEALNNPNESIFFGLYDMFMQLTTPYYRSMMTNEDFREKVYVKWARYNICPDW